MLGKNHYEAIIVNKSLRILFNSFFIIVFMLLLSSFSVAETGYCANPYSSIVCIGTVDSTVCCSPNGEYGKVGGPTSKDDCMQSYFSVSDDTVNGKCDIGCCYAEGVSIDSCDNNYKTECLRQNGEFYDGYCSDITDTGNTLCVEACCCFDYLDGQNAKITLRNTCDNLDNGEFFSGITDSTRCDDKCGVSAVTPPPSVGECNDGEDNDGDGKRDYPADDGCITALDSSETAEVHECNDLIDNDGDGKSDIEDSCCKEYPNTSEIICELNNCEEGQPLYEACKCDESYCGPDSYCCNGICQKGACSESTCTPGERQSCNRFEENCEFFKYCDADGNWGSECVLDGMCAGNIEICDNNIDDNGNGLVDCEDVFCNAVKCSLNNIEDCESRGYYDSINDDYKCCFGGGVSNCFDESDGIVDTCGECNCNKLKTAPDILSLSTSKGQRKVTLEYSLGCNVDFYVFRCEYGCTDVNNYYQIEGPISTRIYHDEEIKANKDYCYFVQAKYDDGALVNSEFKCASTGSEICMFTNREVICLDDTLSRFGDLNIRASCGDYNSLNVIENCDISLGIVDLANETDGENNIGFSAENQKSICVEKSDGRTTCEYQGNCELCGGNLNINTNYEESESYYYDLVKQSSNKMLCKEIPNCYYDYTKSNVNAFLPCSTVNSCYSYHSEFACEGQESTSSSYSSNNKCLPRDCEWKVIDEEKNIGVCFEMQDKYKECSLCSISVFNNVFGGCNVDRCMSFGECYVSSTDDECKSKEYISCNDYRNNADCTGGSNTLIDVTYDDNGNRVSGTNKILARSRDALNFGVCKWDTSKYPDSPCFKDADGDGVYDPYSKDSTPPETRLLSPNKVKQLNLEFYISDKESGPLYTYVCIDNKKDCYPTEEYVVDENNRINLSFGNGNGENNLYVYSIDKAKNLEEIKHFIVEVDRLPPAITISQYQLEDNKNYISDLTLVVNVSEESTCSDSFEITKDNVKHKIENEVGQRWINTFNDLEDGYYDYTIVCTDSVDNEAKKTDIVRVDSDSAIFDPAPNGIIDESLSDSGSRMQLSIKTLNNVECKFDIDKVDYSNMNYRFDSKQISDRGASYYYHYYNYEISTAGKYSFYVKCDLGDRISVDEIEFVYDNRAPVTKVLDSNGEEFDFSGWYNGISNTVYLECEDIPDKGFGCSQTRYCLETTKCSPTSKYEKGHPIDVNVSVEDTIYLCYQSTENFIDGYGGRVEGTLCKEIQIDSFDPELIVNDIDKYEDPSNPYTLSDNIITVSGEVIDLDASGGIPDNNVFLSVYGFVSDTVADAINEGAYNLGGNHSISEEDILREAGLLDDKGTEDKINPVPSEKELEMATDNNSGYSQETLLDPGNYRLKYTIEEKANSDFLATLDLSEGLNMINIEGADRSGAKTNAEILYVYVSEITSSPIEIVSPNAGVSSKNVFDFKIKTMRKAECKFSFTNKDFDSAIPLGRTEDYDVLGNKVYYHTKKDFTLSNTSEVEALVKVQCKDNLGNLFFKEFNLSWDETKPLINKLELTNGFLIEKGGDYIISEYPLSPQIYIETDDLTRCKYSKQTSDSYFTGMIGFEDYNRGFSRNHSNIISGFSDKSSHKIYIQCENAAGLLSKKERLDFRIDGSYPAVIRITSPENPTGISTFNVEIKLSKIAESCKISEDGKEFIALSRVDDYSFKTGATLSLSEGKYGFYFRCLVDSGQADGYDEVIVDLTPPKMTFVKDGTTSSNFYLTASWNASDSLSSIEKYSYSIGTSPGLNNVFGWNETFDNKATEQDLTIDKSKVYYWNVKAMDEAGHWSEVKTSNGVIISDNTSNWINDTDLDNSYCFNGIQDSNESDVDCGRECDSCFNGKVCLEDSDCASNKCYSGICIAMNCSDEILNQAESDVDCGGPCNKCELNQTCLSNDDCKTNFCLSGICTISACDDGFMNGNEEGVDCGGDCSKCQGSTIYNSTTCMTDDKELDSDCDKMPDWYEDKYSLNKVYAGDANSDADEDGYTNLEEYINKTNPIESNIQGKDSIIWILLIIFLLISFVGGGYFVYAEAVVPVLADNESIMKYLRKHKMDKLVTNFTKGNSKKEIMRDLYTNRNHGTSNKAADSFNKNLQDKVKKEDVGKIDNKKKIKESYIVKKEKRNNFLRQKTKELDRSIEANKINNAFSRENNKNEINKLELSKKKRVNIKKSSKKTKLKKV